MRRMFAVLALLCAAPGIAEVPGHNPGLDSECSPGTQWSRETVSCKQAFCPPGSGRTYTLDCNCGEAWDKPYTTCRENGLVVKCVARGQSCATAPVKFDNKTGDCAQGYSWNAMHSDCIATLPSVLNCGVSDVFGKPIENAEITYAEIGADGKPANTQRGKTGPTGTVDIKPGDRNAQNVRILVKAPGYNMTSINRQTGASNDCTLHVLKNEDIERFMKEKYTDFLKRACMPQSIIDTVANVKFAFGTDVSTSRYDPETDTLSVAGGELGDWDALQKTLAHEMSHALSNAIDPTTFYVKGYPLVGKIVGGSHDNWRPVAPQPHMDPREVAYEEGFADFIATLFYRDRKQPYQADLENDATAMEYVHSHPAGDPQKTEGVITSFLVQLYANADPAKALSDFYTASVYDLATWHGRHAARTIDSFVAQKAKEDKSPLTGSCGNAPAANLNDLANRFGVAPESKPRMSIDYSPNAKSSLQNGQELQTGQTYTTPGDGTPMAYERFTPAGEQVVTFDPKKPASFTMNGDGSLAMLGGRVHVADGDVSTPSLHIQHKGTSYLLDVAPNGDLITVIDGTVDAADDKGARVTVNAGEKIEYDRKKGFGTPSSARLWAVDKFWQASRPGAAPRWGHVAGETAAILVVSALFLEIVTRSRKRPRAARPPT